MARSRIQGNSFGFRPRGNRKSNDRPIPGSKMQKAQRDLELRGISLPKPSKSTIVQVPGEGDAAPVTVDVKLTTHSGSLKQDFVGEVLCLLNPTFGGHRSNVVENDSTIKLLPIAESFTLAINPDVLGAIRESGLKFQGIEFATVTRAMLARSFTENGKRPSIRALLSESGNTAALDCLEKLWQEYDLAQEGLQSGSQAIKPMRTPFSIERLPVNIKVRPPIGGGPQPTGFGFNIERL